MRKGLGYKYEHQSRRLGDFVAFMEKRKAKTITTKLAMEWATLRPDRHASWALWLGLTRASASARTIGVAVSSAVAWVARSGSAMTV